MIDFAKNNEGSLDRALRVVLGLAILALTVVGPRSAWGLLGLVPLITGLVGTCPLYTLLGVSTCPRPASRG
jgi:xanthine/uracil permease